MCRETIYTVQLTDITLAETKFRKVDNDLVLFGYHEASVGWVQIPTLRIQATLRKQITLAAI